MTDIVMFHHALGLTEGMHLFADDLRAAGHVVHIPDLLDGRTFTALPDAMAHVEQIGFGTVLERGAAAVEGMRPDVVYAGFSLGVLPAQRLAQTRVGCRGALLYYSCVPMSEFGPSWPDGVPVQIHGMDADPIFAGEGDLDAAREIVDSGARAELYCYPGDAHYFADPTLPTYDAAAAALLRERTHAFLRAVGETTG